MKLFKFWTWLLLPHKFYGGGGGGSTTTTYNQDNPQQQALANVAQQKYDYYKSTYVPVENQWFGQVHNMDNQANHNDAAGMAASTLKQGAGAQTGAVGDSMGGQRLGQGNYLDNASAESNATATANQGVTKRMLDAEQGIVAIGTGQSAGAIDGLSSVAQQSVTGANTDADNKFRQQQATNGIYGTGAGMAAATLINKGVKNG